MYSQEGDRAITDDIPVEYTCDPAKLRLPERHLRCHLRWRTVHWQSEKDTFVAKTMQDACRWLERNYTHDEFFLYVDTFDPHEPWDPPSITGICMIQDSLVRSLTIRYTTTATT